jgi:hypothetical protein
MGWERRLIVFPLACFVVVMGLSLLEGQHGDRGKFSGIPQTRLHITAPLNANYIASLSHSLS